MRTLDKRLAQVARYTLQFEYNTLVSAILESWKIEMNNNNIEVIIPQEMNTELGPLSKLSNKMIRSFFDKQKNHDICAAIFLETQA